MAGTVNEKYGYTINADLDGTPLDDVRIYILDTNLSQVVNKYTGTQGQAAGSIGEQDITAFIYTVTATDTVASAVKNPHNIRALKYGIEVFEINKNIIQSSIDTFFLQTNLYTSFETSAAAASASTITVDHDNRQLRITADTPLTNIYDYLQIEAVTNPQPSAAEVMSTADGTTYNIIYDFIVEPSVTVEDGAGKTLFLPTRTFALSAGAQFGGRVTDINGTQVTLTLTGLVANTEVRVYDAGTTDERAGIENSGTEFSWLYTHVTDFDVDIVIHNVDYEYQRIDDLTLTNAGATIPITQTFDRNYENP